MKVQKTCKHKLLAGLLVIAMAITCLPTMNCSAEANTSEQQFQELYLRLLETGDYSAQDISSLGLPYMTCYNIIEDVKNNEGFMPYQCYTTYHLLTVDQMETIDNVPYLSKFHLGESDEEFLQRYETVKSMVSDVQKELDDNMSDLDKLVYFHEYVVENIYYKDDGEISVHLGGCTLAQGYGVCEGYTNALMIFLKSENIPCTEVAGGAHSWVTVQIDGEWYLVDPTWDDTCSSSCGTHYFLMRNDDEFENTLSKKHADGSVGNTFLNQFSGTISSSTKYTDWYVHDVWNRMYYYNGYWYYVLNNAVRKNNIEGTEESILYTGTNLTITGLEDGVLYFSANGTSQQIELPKKTNTDVPTGDNTPATDSTANSGSTETPSTDGSTSSSSAGTPSTDSSTGSSVTGSTSADGVAGSSSTGNIAADSSTGSTTIGTTTTDGTAGSSTTGTSPTGDTASSSTTGTTPTGGTAGSSTTKNTTTNGSTGSTTTNTSTNSTSTKKVGKPVIKSVTNKKGKKLKIVLKKKVSGATGYEVKISTDKKFKKSVRTVRFTKTNTTITKLSKNKTYYVKVRAYKKNSKGKKIYGAYSNIKKVKIKK